MNKDISMDLIYNLVLPNAIGFGSVYQGVYLYQKYISTQKRHGIDTVYRRTRIYL